MLTAAIVVALAIVGAAVVFPVRLMAALFGRSFSAAGRPFAILAAAMALVLIEAILSNVLIAGSRDKAYAQIVTLAACVNVGLNLALIPAFAARGSALATLATETLLIALTLTATRSIVGLPRLDVPRLGRRVACASLMCGVMVALGALSVWLAVCRSCRLCRLVRGIPRFRPRPVAPWPMMSSRRSDGDGSGQCGVSAERVGRGAQPDLGILACRDGRLSACGPAAAP